MDYQIDHSIAKSLKEFLSWKCLHDLRAFKNVTGSFARYDPKWYGKTALGSAYPGWVYDASIDGATVPYSLPSVSGSIVDYRNGRFIAPSGANYTGQAEFSVADFNFYITSSPESKLIFETKYQQSPVRLNPTGYLPEDSFVAPCVFVKSFSSTSEEYALGGETKVEWLFKIIAMTRRESELLAIQKVVRDSKQEIFPILSGTIFNQYGSLATPGWSYQDEISAMTDYAFVEDSSFKIVEGDVFTDDNPKMFVGIGNIEVSYYKEATPTYVPEQEFYLLLESGDEGDILELEFDSGNYLVLENS